MIDTHAHLDFPEFKADRDVVVQRALEAGVNGIIAVGVDLKSSRRVVELADRYPSVSAAVGVHPSDANTWTGSVAIELASLAKHPKVVAVGEIGLDFYRDRAPRDVQRRSFREQLDLAAELGLPVIVHDREAHQEVLASLAAWAADAKVAGQARYRQGLGVLHCFSGDQAMAEQLVALGFLISFAGPITYPRSAHLTALAKRLPLSSIVIETDCPYLTPQRWRGQRNEPAYVTAVADRIAEVRGIPTASVAEATTANAQRMFGIVVTG